MSSCLVRSYRNKILFLLYFYLCWALCWVYKSLMQQVPANQNDERRVFTTFQALTLPRITCFYYEIWLVCSVSCGALIGSAVTVKTLLTPPPFHLLRSPIYWAFPPSVPRSLPLPTAECNIVLILASLFVAETNCEENVKVAVEDVKRKRKKRKAKTWQEAVI